MKLDMEELKVTEDTSVAIEAPVRNTRKMKPRTIQKSNSESDESTPVCCLRNERIIVRHVPKENSNITNPKHILHGGMAENAFKYFSVPKLQSGAYVNILTDSEKEYLEQIMGLEYNALSIYKKEDNYWENRMVRLGKSDNYFDLSDPEQYISYKILLANKDYIAHSLSELEERPKATYMFVIVAENEETKLAKKEMTSTMQSYMEFGKIQDNEDILRLVIEAMEGRPVSSSTKLDILQSKVNKLIQTSPVTFLKAVKDEYMTTKVIIRKAADKGIVSNRSGMYYMRDDGSQLCKKGEDPTFTNAARYLSAPAQQELRFFIEGKLKEK